MSMFLRLETASRLLGTRNSSNTITYIPLNMVQKVKSSEAGDGSVIHYYDASGTASLITVALSPDVLFAECLVDLAKE